MERATSFDAALLPFNKLWRFKRLPAVVPTLATTAAAAESAFRFRTRFVDVQRTAIEFAAVQFGDGAIRIRVCAHLDESKTTRLPCVTIRDDAHTLYRPVRLEQRSNRAFGCPKAEVSYKNILHFVSL